VSIITATCMNSYVPNLTNLILTHNPGNILLNACTSPQFLKIILSLVCQMTVLKILPNFVKISKFYKFQMVSRITHCPFEDDKRVNYDCFFPYNSYSRQSAVRLYYMSAHCKSSTTVNFTDFGKQMIFALKISGS
jgi:hypothetical protein